MKKEKQGLLAMLSLKLFHEELLVISRSAHGVSQRSLREPITQRYL